MTIGAEELELLVATVRRIADDAGPTGGWERMAEAGLALLAVAEPEGAGSLAAAAAVTRVVGERALDVAYADTAIVAAPVLAAAGLPVPAGPVAVGADGEVAAEPAADGWHLRGELHRVAWASRAERIVAVAVGDTGVLVVSLDPDAVDITVGTNLAGEPRDHVRIDAVVPRTAAAPAHPDVRQEIARRGALARAVAMSGAAEAALRASVRYASERVQFGRPIAKLQAVQHALAALAAEVEAIRAAADAAVDVCAADGFASDRALLAVAIAKSQAGIGAETVTRIAHQVHGAIGTTREHPLHRFTTRLWSWRDEFGSERHWDATLGRIAITDDPWEALTR